MLVKRNDVIYFTIKNERGYTLHEIEIYSNGKIIVKDSTISASVVHRLKTDITINSSTLEVMMFVINHGGYIMTEYGTLKKDIRRTESKKYIKMMTSPDFTHLSEDEMKEHIIAYTTGFLSESELDDESQDSIVEAYNNGKIHRMINNVETNIRRRERKYWKRDIRKGK